MEEEIGGRLLVVQEGRRQVRPPAMPGIDEARLDIPSDNLPPTATDSAALGPCSILPSNHAYSM